MTNIGKKEPPAKTVGGKGSRGKQEQTGYWGFFQYLYLMVLSSC